MPPKLDVLGADSSVVVKKSISILFVDDDEAILELLSRAADGLGSVSNVDQASSYKDALILIEHQAYDLVVIDYLLGDGNGLDLLKELKDHKPYLKSIFLTSHGDKDVLATAIDLGVNAFLAKPFHLPEIRHHLEAQIETLAKDIALAEAVDHYSSLVNALPEIIYKIDAKGHFVFINDAIRNMGYEPSELIGQHISVLIHPEDYSRANSQDVLKSFRGKITGESHAPKLLDERRKGDRMTSNLQIRLVGKKESATAAPTIYSAMVNAYGEISCSGFFEQDYLNSHEKFEGTVGVIRDISKRVRYERELMDSRLKAEAASRAKSDFIANMSHETRTPLAHILGCVDQILDQEHGLNEKIALDTELNIVEQLKASADQLNSVLEDVLALSELDRGERNINVTPFVCSDLKDSVVQHFESIAFEKGLAFSFDLNAEKHLCHGDLVVIKDVIFRLVSNAIKFTHSGSIKLILKIVKQKYHQHMMISVKDTGVGITEDQKETIFDRFVQGEPSLSKRYGGTGAGLALCRELCELMGGTLTLCSTVGEGAHFEVKIPISPLDPDAGSVVNRKVDFDGQVLLVCESLERSEHLSRRLDQLGLQVMTVNSPNEAIKSFMMTNIVLVIVEEDLAIQNRGGLMRELRNFIQDDEILPIFVIQHLQSEDALMGIGATAVLPPLFRASELVALIEPWKRQIDLEQQKSHRAFLVELGLEELETQEDDGQKSP